MRVLSAMLRQESLLESMEPDEREELWSATAELSSIFSHALVRDVVYQSQLATEQRALHAAAAAAYEEVYSGSARRARLYEIAEHYERAGVRDRALVCLAEAAEYALEEYENERAIDLLRRRVALADSADFGARHELGRALIRVGAWDEAAEVLEAVVSGLDAVPAGADPGDVVDCLVALADLYIDQGATDNAGSLIQRGISLAEQHDYYAGLAYLYRNRGLIAYRRQDLDAALHAYETGLSHARREGGERVIARVYNDMAIVLTKMGRHEEALEAFRANLDLARRLNEFAGISAALNNIGFLYNEMHRPDDAVAYFREDLELCHAAGNRQGRSVALGNIGDIMFVLESHEEAIERFREAIAIDRQIGFLPHESYMHQQLGRVLVDLDRVEEGCGELHEALRIAEEIDFPMVRDKTQELGSACHG
jgi:tetratricopeptide (TPR) repeat protein